MKMLSCLIFDLKKIDFKVLKDMVRRGSNSVALDFLIQGASYFLRINRTGIFLAPLRDLCINRDSKIQFLSNW
ncbi:hypothetical protein BSPLISOX_3200 [uncultured Gammaproteobacteria bacterium]|nr:hypothetical protein [uncultured Gammaproteobacteria bacterium]CAC9435953.1 hypothetical protein [uncultured Gammaproteobacteria bacterium]CAC9436348.1 hypothetical protein [uncultured Gammaproteobacteria bacterium]VVH66231.1 hypothetical protein BSPLISOX_3196 [uncultured Gammaproteobacteria bacterium]VVH66235.1 hypothetical protein BSPLISOX_3200 [uncultured Gammaproteobacteria bacterium]